MASCTSLRAPVEPPHIEPGNSVSAEEREIRIAIVPIEGSPAYEQLFEEDLTQLGIAAAWVSIRNMRADPVDLRQLQWFFYREGKRYDALQTKQLFARYYRARKIRAYTLSADQKARLQVEKLLFRTERLMPGALKEGFVYFKIDPSFPTEWTGDGSVHARDILLEDGSKISIEVQMAHVDP